MPQDNHTPFTLEEHRDLGAEMRTSTARLRHLCDLVAGVYGADSLPGLHFRKAMEALDELNGQLEVQAARDLPGRVVQNLYR